ncbi:hypothetical protein R1sor_006117 [Riccia sorocarpa]|uniref:Uncharacterized protein n=1 Tax=Riccia sorocarpa TaxID=122646 RepID=A0ABD3HNS7_9MARC
MAPKSSKKRDKIPVKSPVRTPSQSPVTTPKAPLSSSTPTKVGVCKSLALPTIAMKEFRSRFEELGMGFLFWRWDFSTETLVKEFATVKSEVDLPHRGKPYEWTIAHWRKALGRSDEDDEGGIVWDAQVTRLTMPEGVNPEELFSEKRPEKDKNGYKTRSYKDPFKKVLAEALMALFCPAPHDVPFNDGNLVYVGAFLVYLHAKNGWLTEDEKKLYGEDHPDAKNIADYSSDEDDTSSDEEQAVALEVLVKDTEDEEEGTPRPRVQFSFEDAVRKPKSPTSPNYSPQATPEPKTKKRMRGEVPRAKKALRIDLEDTTKNREEVEDEDEDEDEGQHKSKQLLEEGVEVEIQEQGEPARLTSPSPSCAMTVENLTKYLMPTFATIEGEGRLMYRKFEAGPDHLNATTEIIRRARIFGENTEMEYKLRTALRKQKDQVRKGNETIEEHKDTIDALEKDKKELQDIVKMKDERMKKLESEFEALKIAKAAQDEELKVKDTKITNLQVQWIERREVEEKEAAIGSLRDSLKEIYEAMKTEFPSKKEKKSRLQKLADRTKGDYEGILREYRDDFGEFKRRLLSKTDAPTTSGRSS